MVILEQTNVGSICMFAIVLSIVQYHCIEFATNLMLTTAEVYTGCLN